MFLGRLYREFIFSYFLSLSLSTARLLMGNMCIGCMHAYIGMKGDNSFGRVQRYFYVWMLPQMSTVKVVRITYQPTSSKILINN